MVRKEVSKKKILIASYIIDIRKCLDEIDFDIILKIANILKSSNKIFIMGNGGSSSTASHMANDFQKQCGLKAICLTDNIPLVTAWANDTTYDNIFIEQLEVLSESKGDTLILITGSGNSQNIINAAIWGLSHGRNVIALIGTGGGRIINMKKVHILHIKADMMPFEDISLIIDHILTTILSC